METTTPFDLNRAIQNWRNTLSQSPALREEDLYELETHVRESVVALQKQGLSQEEAFLVALKRVGQASALEAEFAIQNRKLVWLDRGLWMLAGMQLWTLAGVSTGYLQVVCNATVPKVNEWLATYGFGRIPESMPAQVLFVAGMPAILLVVVWVCFWFSRRAMRHGWSPLVFLLDRPRLLAGLFAFGYLSPLLVNFVMGLLVSKMGWQRHQGIPGASGATLAVTIGLQTLLFGIMAWWIARGRLKAKATAQ